MTVEPRKPPYFWIAATAVLMVFTVLLAARLGFWPKSSAKPAPQTRPPVAEATEDWMAIYQNDDQIGYSHRRFQPTAEGFRMADDTFMRVNTMGMVQDVRLRTVGRLRRDMSLAAFDFRLASNLFAFQAHGTVAGNSLRVTIGEHTSEIGLSGPIYLASGILNGLRFEGPGSDQPRTFPVFDPSTLSQRPVTVTPEAQETIEVLGRPTPTRRLKVEFAGASGLAWVDSQGRVVREKGLMGIEIRRTTREAALAGLNTDPAADLTDVAAVPVDKPIEAPDRLTRLQMRVTGIAAASAEGGAPIPEIAGRQTFTDGLLTVARETVPDPAEDDIAGQQDYLKATALIQSGDPKIQKAAAAVVQEKDRPAERVRKLMAWVYANLEKRPVVSVPNALEVLERRMGDCNEHAVLMAALCRAAGIPARVEAGLVYHRGAFYYHAWNSVWLGRWVTVDALMNQLPADVTHLSLASGEPTDAVDLMGMIGRIRLAMVDSR